jgi:hypothetical protein
MTVVENKQKYPAWLIDHARGQITNKRIGISIHFLLLNPFRRI